MGEMTPSLSCSRVMASFGVTADGELYSALFDSDLRFEWHFHGQERCFLIPARRSTFCGQLCWIDTGV